MGNSVGTHNRVSTAEVRGKSSSFPHQRKRSVVTSFLLCCYRQRRGYQVAPATILITETLPDASQKWAWCKYHNMGNGNRKPLHHPDATSFNELIATKGPKVSYKITKNIIGSGGFSKVKLATITKSSSNLSKVKQQVAVKITSNKDKAAQREVELLTFLGSVEKNICELVDFYPRGNELHMVFEYCPGGDIMDLVQEHTRLSEEEGATVAACITNALAYCHSKNIAHRDIKGENVLCFRAEGDTPLVCKLADFGCATYFEDYNQFFSQKIGSSCYMAPEVVKERYMPAKADLWSLGVTIYTILHGEPPFHGPTHDLTFQRVLEETVTLPISISKQHSSACQNFILQCMQRRVWKRPTSAVLSKHPWLQPKGESYPSMEIPKTEDPRAIPEEEFLKMTI